MLSLRKVKGAFIQHLDAAARQVTVSVPPGQWETCDSLSFRVDEGALVATKQHELMKLEAFQIGSRISAICAQQPDGTWLAKSLILERGVSVVAGRGLPA